MNAPKSKLSIVEIRDVALAMRARIEAIKMSYRFNSVPTEIEKQLRPVKVPPRQEQRKFAIRQSLESAEVEGFNDGSPISERYVADGKHMIFSVEGDSSYVVRLADNLHTRCQQTQPYCLAMDLKYLFSDKIAGGSWRFPEVVPFEGYGVRERQEKVNGQWCHVIEHPHNAHRRIKELGIGEQVHRIWVDTANPAVMLKREFAFTMEEEILPWILTYYESLQEVIDEVVLPYRIRQQAFAGPTDNHELLGKPLCNSTIDVTELTLNDDVTETDFEFCVPKGDLSFYSNNYRRDDVEGWPCHSILQAQDGPRVVPMPFDQPANEILSKAILEKDAKFFE